MSEAYPWNTSTHTAETGKLVTAVIQTREAARDNEAAGAKKEDISHSPRYATDDMLRATELISLIYPPHAKNLSHRCNQEDNKASKSSEKELT